MERSSAVDAGTVVTVGEVLLRLSVPPGHALRNLPAMEARPAGAEANVARNLARLGHATTFLSCLPENALGRGVADELRRSGVDTGSIRWRETGRMGTFFVQLAEPPRAVEVVYDRAGSCAAAMAPEDLDETALRQCRVLHLSGILPALSASCAATGLRAVELAQAGGATISFDVNYRGRLWSGPEAARGVQAFLERADVVFCSRRDARTLWSLAGEGEELIRQLRERTSARHVISTDGASGVCAWMDGLGYRQQAAVPVRVVDRLGAGDALASGFLHGLLRGERDRALAYGVWLAAMALTEHGDCPTVGAAELDRSVRAAGLEVHPRR